MKIVFLKKIECQYCEGFYCKKRLSKHNCEKNKFINDTTLLVGPSFSGVLCSLAKNLKHIFKRGIFNVARSPELHFEEFNNEEIREMSQYQGRIIVFDDMLDSNRKTFDPFFKEEDMNFWIFIFDHNLILIHQREQ